MALGKLTPLQERILVLLAGLAPPWTLSGGAALAGFHTAHRETRDLDLFWQGRSELGDIAEHVRERLADAGLTVASLQVRAAFSQFDVADSTGEHVVLDLIADPVPLSEPPLLKAIGGTTVRVDSPHQILVNKLCAVLGRSEPRDLEDIKVLLERGGELERALRDCPQQDAGFSPLTLAWTLESLHVERLATALGWARERVYAVVEFKQTLIQRVLRSARPD